MPATGEICSIDVKNLAHETDATPNCLNPSTPPITPHPSRGTWAPAICRKTELATLAIIRNGLNGLACPAELGRRGVPPVHGTAWSSPFFVAGGDPSLCNAQIGCFIRTAAGSAVTLEIPGHNDNYSFA